MDITRLTGNKKPAVTRVLWTSLDRIKQVIGGAGGNRTPVRKPSTDSSTYLAVLFDLTQDPPTSKRGLSELPWI
jgi:hypothetical protein